MKEENCPICGKPRRIWYSGYGGTRILCCEDILCNDKGKKIE